MIHKIVFFEGLKNRIKLDIGKKSIFKNQNMVFFIVKVHL